MATSPQYRRSRATSLRLDDVNGDGLDDLVQVRFNAVDVWLNVDGVGWTERHITGEHAASPSSRIACGWSTSTAPARPTFSGATATSTGTSIWRAASGRGCSNGFENGLGKTTEIEYSTSSRKCWRPRRASRPRRSWAVDEAHADLGPRREARHRARQPRSDRAAAGIYVTEYTYRDPVYEGRQREFRGFTRARQRLRRRRTARRTSRRHVLARRMRRYRRLVASTLATTRTATSTTRGTP